MDNKYEARLKELVDKLYNSTDATNKNELILAMREIEQIVELLKWEEKYNNTDSFIFVD